MDELSLFETIVLAIVEGLTEFLPVSSTGHLIITQGIMGIESTSFVKAFTVIIQFGAILSVVWLYRKKLFKVNKNEPIDKEDLAKKSFSKKMSFYFKRFIHKYDLYWKLFIAFIPAAVIGLLLEKHIDSLLENVTTVAVMLVLGGIFMIFSDKIFKNQPENIELTEKKAFNIGLFQCIAMIPGVSRSMATIMGGMAQKLTRKAAAEFSFFLAIPTMFAATCYKLLKLYLEEDVTVLTNNMTTLIVGNVVAFLVGMLAIKFFINYITKYGFKAFGYYRIIVGVLILALSLLGYNLEVA